MLGFEDTVGWVLTVGLLDFDGDTDVLGFEDTVGWVLSVGMLDKDGDELTDGHPVALG